jgi:hypothetical protein
MVIWSVPFAGLVAVAAILAVTRQHGVAPALLVAMLIGPFLGLGYFALLAEARGGWKLAFPAFVCWAYGGGAGLLTAVAVGFRSGRAAAALCAIALLAGVGWTYGQLDEQEHASRAVRPKP